MTGAALTLALIALAALALTAWWALIDHLIDRRADRRIDMARELCRHNTPTTPLRDTTTSSSSWSVR